MRKLEDRFASGGAKPVSLAFVQFGLGRQDEGLAWLERGAAVVDPQLYFSVHFPVFDDVRSDPRFERVRQRIHAEPLGR